MLFQTHTFITLGLWASTLRTVRCENKLTANPSTGTSIILDVGYDTGFVDRLSITSDIPVNIQRYADVDATFLADAHPVSATGVRVVITSDCMDTTSDEMDLPTVAFSEETGNINVNLNSTTDMSYLDPSWYDALWSYTSIWTGEWMTTTMATLSANDDAVFVTTDTTATVETEIEETSKEVATSDVGDIETSSSSGPDAEEDNDTTGSSGATLRIAFVRQAITTFIVLYATNVIAVGVGSNVGLLSFGKVTVSALAVSALFSKMQPKKSQNPDGIARKLQMCKYNADILLDGCYNSFTINAPAARIIDAVLVNQTSTQNPNDSGTTDYSAILTFPVSEENIDLSPNTTVPNIECLIIAEGRPFVDASGKSLRAPSIVENVDASWLGYVEVEMTNTAQAGNQTDQSTLILGNEWIRRALAEHASIASFSAFSIALMTNQAPSQLVKDALNAALDEVRHAKVSFDITSLLTGEEVGPGHLPDSNLDFTQDLTALALAVAKEGCVDETLSTYSAVLEANTIDDAIADSITEGRIQDSHYHGVDNGILTLMRDELRTIAIEESTHSALAWRTLNWICSVDAEACNVVHEKVFHESYLKTRISQMISNKHPKSFQMIENEWMKIFTSHKSRSVFHTDEHLQEQPVCNISYKEEDLNEISLISRLTASIERGVLCG